MTTKSRPARKQPVAKQPVQKQLITKQPETITITGKHQEAVETIVIKGKFKKPGIQEEEIISQQFVAEPDITEGTPALQISTNQGVQTIGGAPVIVDAQPGLHGPDTELSLNNGEGKPGEVYMQCEDPDCQCRLGKLLKSHRIDGTRLQQLLSAKGGCANGVCQKDGGCLDGTCLKGDRLPRLRKGNPLRGGRCETGSCATEVVERPGDDSAILTENVQLAETNVTEPMESQIGTYFDSAESCRQTSNMIGFGAAILSRDLNGGRDIAYEAAMPTNILNTGNVDEGDLGGFDGYIIHRGPQGRGWEARYLGVYSDGGNNFIPAPALTSLVGLDNLQTSVGNGNDLFTDPTANQTLFRSSELHSAEVNFLNQRSQTFLGRNACMREDLFGFRFLSFNESLQYIADISAAPVAGASFNAYDSDVENTLFGFQAGRRMELPMKGRLSLGLLGKLGLFNNRVRTEQRLTRQDANRIGIEVATINNEGGADFDLYDTKDDLAFLGEADAGLIFRVSQNSRIKIGYRVVAATGIAIAEDQIPADFNDLTIARNANTDGDLILHGGYFGFELAR